MKEIVTKQSIHCSSHFSILIHHTNKNMNPIGGNSLPEIYSVQLHDTKKIIFPPHI